MSPDSRPKDARLRTGADRARQLTRAGAGRPRRRRARAWLPGHAGLLPVQARADRLRIPSRRAARPRRGDCHESAPRNVHVGQDGPCRRRAPLDSLERGIAATTRLAVDPELEGVTGVFSTASTRLTGHLGCGTRGPGTTVAAQRTANRMTRWPRACGATATASSTWRTARHGSSGAAAAIRLADAQVAAAWASYMRSKIVHWPCRLPRTSPEGTADAVYEAAAAALPKDPPWPRCQPGPGSSGSTTAHSALLMSEGQRLGLLLRLTPPGQHRHAIPALVCGCCGNDAAAGGTRCNDMKVLCTA